MRRLLPRLLLAAVLAAAPAAADMGPLAPVLKLGADGPWTATEDNGAYLLENRSDDGAVTYKYLFADPSDEGRREISVDVTIRDGDGLSRAGLLYGFRQQPRFYYMLMLEPGARVTLYRRDQDGLAEMVSTRSDSIGPAANRLTIREDGDQIAILVNGERLSAIRSTGTGGGATGIAAWGMGAYRFDNFRQTVPGAQDEGSRKPAPLGEQPRPWAEPEPPSPPAPNPRQP